VLARSGDLRIKEIANPKSVEVRLPTQACAGSRLLYGEVSRSGVVTGPPTGPRRWDRSCGRLGLEQTFLPRFDRPDGDLSRSTIEVAFQFPSFDKFADVPFRRVKQFTGLVQTHGRLGGQFCCPFNRLSGQMLMPAQLDFAPVQ
jgi:hypothetical protein